VAFACRNGFDDYWTKPINLPRFLSRMDQLERGGPYVP
jgi:hypothetical protein